MQKDFDTWNVRKKYIHEEKRRPFFHKREIWWCVLGLNVGHEQDGTGENFDRPVVIIKGCGKDTFFAVALTGAKKEGKDYFFIGEIQGQEATTVLSQVRLVDAKRLRDKIGMLNKEKFDLLKETLKVKLFS